MIDHEISQPLLDAKTAIERLHKIYNQAVSALRRALNLYLETGERPDPEQRILGLFCYPVLKVVWTAETPPPRLSRAFARLNRPGVYVTTITRPDVFDAYLTEQLGLLERDYGAGFIVEASSLEIPYPFVLDGANLDLDGAVSADLARHFPATDLAFISDDVADGLWDLTPDDERPLALFDGLRTDFSLARLKHYTGTPADHTQNFVLFTNYHRYVDAFVDWACEELKDPNSRYTHLSCPGGIVVNAHTENPQKLIADGPWRRHQMPA